MTRVELTWTWVTESPLHVGSGLSRPAVADRLVQRDSRRRPLIPGDAVKGALRLSAEQILAWLGAGSGSPAGSEPARPLMRLVFGGAAEHGASFGAGRWESVGPSDDEPTFTLTSTAIDRSSGTAEPHALRTIEVVRTGERFATGCTLDVPESLADPVATLIVSALLATESVGARSGAGLGRVRIEAPKLCIGGEQRGIEALVGELALATMIESLDLMAEAPPRPGLDIGLEAEPVWFRLALTVEEPTTLTDRPVVSNAARTLPEVPATTLRGALRASLTAAGASDLQLDAILGPGSRWSPGIPIDENDTPAVPAPRTLVRPKRSAGLHEAHDLLCGDPAWEDSRRPLDERWIVPGRDPALPIRDVAANAGREIRMHVARDYTTGSKRAGALYAREALVGLDGEPVRLVAWARLPLAAGLPERARQIRLGKRLSAGSGRTTVTMERDEPPWLEPGPPRDGQVLVQLLTPALVRDAESGHLLRSLPKRQWEQLLGDGIALASVEAWSSTTAVSGWMRDWGHGRTTETALAAGSVWRIRPATTTPLDDLRSALTRLTRDGLGERAHEGFGWLAVDPDWLGRLSSPSPAGSEEGQPDAVDDHAVLGTMRRWPGVETIDPADLVSLDEEAQRAVAAMSTKARNELPGPLQELARRSRIEQEKVTDILAHCDEMAGRKHPRAWAHLASRDESGNVPPARALLDTYAGRDQAFLFVLEALLIRLGRPR